MASPKLELFEAIIDDIVTQAAKNVANGEELSAMLFTFSFDKEGGQVHRSNITSVDSMHASVNGKNALAALMNRMMMDSDSPVDALVYLSEAWMSIPKEGQRLLDIPPSEDPERTEAVVVVCRTKTTTVSRLYAIDRKDNSLHLMDTKGIMGGRMVGEEEGTRH